jgi:hypothetical protein
MTFNIDTEIDVTKYFYESVANNGNNNHFIFVKNYDQKRYEVTDLKIVNNNIVKIKYFNDTEEFTIDAFKNYFSYNLHTKKEDKIEMC